MTAKTAPSLEEIQAAQRRIAGIARVTPVYSSETFSRLTGRPVHLKAENLQRTGAFKIRGAVNKIAQLSPEEHAAGVVTASAGNHGQAVAWAAREAGALARIFMPHDTPMAKVEAHAELRRARRSLHGETFEEALAAALDHSASENVTFLHAFEDEQVIAGQGTIGLELARAGSRPRDRDHPDRRRRARLRHRARDQGGEAERAPGGRADGSVRAPRRR